MGARVRLIRHMTMAWAVAWTVGLGLGQQAVPVVDGGRGEPVLVKAGEGAGEAPRRTAADAAISTRRDARAITQALPAPRGLITGRNGEPLAQNRVAYQLALQFPQFESVDNAFIVGWAREHIVAAKKLRESLFEKTDEELLDHYRHRRWLPLYLSSLVRAEEAESIAGKIEPRYRKEIILAPVYARVYPEGSLAAHIIGYTGSVGKLPTGPINFNEPLWEMAEGRAGLEKIFDRELTGTPGTRRLVFDSDGKELLREQTKRPVPGGTVVTTLNLDWQRRAEKVLDTHCRRGAFVVVDVVTGEVLAMASRPSFDLNMFIPGIADADYKALLEDPGRPLFGRAFQGVYPPASSFKPIVALAALNNGTITEHTAVNCPAYVSYGNHQLWNWSRSAYGPLAVESAIKWSNNPWFAQVGNRVGSQVFLGLAKRLGFGSRTGLPLIGEDAGLVPTAEWVRERYGRQITEGDAANWAIGQGALLTTPLQVAQAMAGIANGGALPKLHLVRQVHDRRGRVISAATPERRNWLGLDPKVVKVVHDGMNGVVDGGTGSRASLSFTSVCGKTGTGQWGPKAKNQGVAWFAGFLPHEEPRLAFACLYEGRPGEKVSGSRNGCPMVPAFFEPLKDEIKELIAPPPKAVVIVDPEAEDQGTAPKAIPVDPGEVGTGLEDERPEGILRPQPVEPPPAGPGGGPAVDDVFDPAAPDDSGSPAEEMVEPEVPPVPRALPVRPEELGE